MYLYHYYQAGTSPFRNLSELTDQEARRVMEREVPHYMVVVACPWLSSWYEPGSLSGSPSENLTCLPFPSPMGIPIPPFLQR